jgi:hypothetical protein
MLAQNRSESCPTDSVTEESWRTCVRSLQCVRQTTEKPSGLTKRPCRFRQSDVDQCETWNGNYCSAIGRAMLSVVVAALLAVLITFALSQSRAHAIDHEPLFAVLCDF